MKRKSIYAAMALCLLTTTVTPIINPPVVHAQSDGFGLSPYDHIIDRVYQYLSPADKRRVDAARAANARCLAKAAISASAASVRGGWGGAAIAFMATLATCGW